MPAAVGRDTRTTMGYDMATAERVRRILSDRPGVVEKRMVGGLSFNVHGSMCCGVTGTALMIRVGPEARDRTLAEPHVRPMVLGGKTLAAFVCVDPEGFATDDALRAWIQRGLDFVATLGPTHPAWVERASPFGERKTHRSRGCRPT